MIVLLFFSVLAAQVTQLCIQNCPPITPEQRIRALYQSLIYTNIPNPITIATGADDISLITDIFENNTILGRCWPYGIFQNITAVKLFFWGIASQSTRCTSTSISDLVVSTTANTVWVRASLTFVDDFGALNGLYGSLRRNNGNPYTIDQIGRFTMGSNSKIQYFDLVASNLGASFDNIYTNFTNVLLGVDLLCQSHSLYCSGTNPIYASYSECYDYFSNATLNGSMSIGSWDRANEENLICRISGLSWFSKNSNFCSWLSPVGSNPFCQPSDVGIWQALTVDVFPNVPQGSTCNEGWKLFNLNLPILMILIYLNFENFY